MAGQGRLRPLLRRWHVWLGWLIAVPMLLWTLSGLVMVIKPIEEVRGEALFAPPASMRIADPVVPRLAGLSVQSLVLAPRAAGPRWVVELADDSRRIADPVSGAWLPALSAADAVREVRARYRGEARIIAVHRTRADAPPIDLRRPVDSWQVVMDDGLHVYVDAATGEIIARRTRFWRLYDFFWGLHIMDPTGREDTHSPWLIASAGVALVTTLMALVLLPLSRRRRRLAGKA